MLQNRTGLTLNILEVWTIWGWGGCILIIGKH